MLCSLFLREAYFRERLNLTQVRYTRNFNYRYTLLLEWDEKSWHASVFEPAIGGQTRDHSLATSSRVILISVPPYFLYVDML